ncbi:MAG: extracellular solute-binding protein, partial [Candidatus Omnitrophica bacterium]|nr:extracellular solute-binding protein [Candidatus Omnitrophota bacterium]
MLTTKKLVAFITAVFIAFSQAGCGSVKQQKNEIVMWLVGTEAQSKTIMELGKEFTEKTGVKVLCQAISWGDAHSKYLTAIAGDVTPDIGTMGLTWGMEFGNLGAMVDLKKEYREDVMGLEKKMFPGLLRSTQLGESVYGVPFDLSEQILYYRTDIIPRAPRNWDDLIAAIRDLKAQEKGMVFDWGSLEWIGYSPFLWQAGGNYFNADHSKVTLDSPEAVKAMEFYAQLYKEGVPKTQVPVEQGMRTGDYPMAISGNWKIISLMVGAPEIKGKWAIAPLPAGPTGKKTAFIGGRVLGIFSKSNMKKEAWEFIKFLFEPENQLKIYKDSIATEDSYLPPNMDTWATLPMDPAFKNVLEAQAKDSQGPPPVLSWDGSTRFVNEAIQMVVLKNADPAAEL